MAKGDLEVRIYVRTFLRPLRNLTRFRKVGGHYNTGYKVLGISKYVRSRGIRLVCKLSKLFPCRLVLTSSRHGTGRVCRSCHFCSGGMCFCPTGSLLFFRTSVRKGLLVQRQVHIVQTLLRRRRIAIIADVSKYVSFLVPLRGVEDELLRFGDSDIVSLSRLGRRLMRLKCRHANRMRLPKRFSIHKKVVSVCSLARSGP